MEKQQNKNIPAAIVNVDAEGKKSTYRLTKKKPAMVLYFENREAFNGETELEQHTRRAGLFIDAALTELEMLPAELRRAALSDYGLIEKAEENARPEFLEGIGIMPKIRDNRVVCPTCNRVSNQRVTPDTEFEHLPFVCPHCNSGSYISYTGANVELEEP